MARCSCRAGLETRPYGMVGTLIPGGNNGTMNMAERLSFAPRYQPVSQAEEQVMAPKNKAPKAEVKSPSKDGQNDKPAAAQEVL